LADRGPAAEFHSSSGQEEILVSASTTAMTSSPSVYATPAFWERLWRTGGIQSIFFFILAYLVYGHQPQVSASLDALVAFYDGERTRILIAAVFSGLAILNLMWFAAALRTTLADAEQDGWGAAATASSDVHAVSRAGGPRWQESKWQLETGLPLREEFATP
jgi:hypothetical protein